jgi:hypothetical protein
VIERWVCTSQSMIRRSAGVDPGAGVPCPVRSCVWWGRGGSAYRLFIYCIFRAKETLPFHTLGSSPAIVSTSSIRRFGTRVGGGHLLRCNGLVVTVVVGGLAVNQENLLFHGISTHEARCKDGELLGAKPTSTGRELVSCRCNINFCYSYFLQN